MNTSRHPHDPAAEEQASLWAARLEGGTLEAADRAALDTWLAAKPAHRALLSDYCQFSADLEQTLPDLVEAGAVRLPPPATPSRRRWSLSWLGLAGGALAAAAAVAVVVKVATPASKVETLATAPAQRQSFTLSDGTKIELNAQTSLLVEITADERHVRLASGEAFFEVAKDKSRPFIIETPTGSVRVTGTVFNVRTDKVSELDVTVVEGSVQVRPADTTGTGAITPVDLTANKHLSAIGGKVLVQTLTPDALEDALAWRQGMVVFKEGTTLNAALACFAQYHGRGIGSSPAAANLSVGGLYKLDDLKSFYDDIMQVHPVRINFEPSGTVRVSLRSEP